MLQRAAIPLVLWAAALLPGPAALHAPGMGRGASGEPNATNASSKSASAAAEPGLRHFIGADGLFCAQGSHRDAAGALALYKALPRGELFKESHVYRHSTWSCEEMGYNFSDGEDKCYPGVHIFHRNAEEKKEYFDKLQSTFDWFGNYPNAPWHFNLSFVNMMDACACHSASPNAAYFGDKCGEVSKVAASFVHRDPYYGRGLFCKSGPWILMTRTLAVLKSTALAPLHLADSVSHHNCSFHGFPHQQAGEDKCFTGLKLWTREKVIAEDHLAREAWSWMQYYNNGGFDDFAAEHGLDAAALEPHRNCQCSPYSEFGMGMQAKCPMPGASSPIRDWWRD